MKSIVVLIFIVINSLMVTSCGGGGGKNPAFLDEELIISPLKSGLNNAIINSASRGEVKTEVYLPPEWDKNATTTYPVIFFLHGQGGSQKEFFKTVEFTQLDEWINESELPSFVLVAIQSHWKQGNEQQWSSPENEVFLTSTETTELRAYVLQNFNAGDALDTSEVTKTSIHGYSRGARGAIHYALKFPHKFTSAVADAFVSDYALTEEKKNALENKALFIENGIKLRMSIGDRDHYDQTRHATIQMHNYLESINIPHEYEVLPDASHNYYTIWNSIIQNDNHNGLYELKYHSNTW